MDLEKLTKHQILLLTLLVSFVTSIATGIVTVSLMDQAPEGVTKVINQVVERTVEKVAPATQGASVATETTVVVKQDDLVPKSIATAQKSIVRIVPRGSTQLIARGVMSEKSGKVLTDAAALKASGVKAFDAILSNGDRVPATLHTDATTGIVEMDLTLGTSTGFVPAIFAKAANLTLGQTVISIGGTSGDIVGQGVIASLPSDAQATVILTSVPSVTPGAVLITIFGEVIGMSTSGSIAVDPSSYHMFPSVVPVTNATPNT